MIFGGNKKRIVQDSCRACNSAIHSPAGKQGMSDSCRELQNCKPGTMQEATCGGVGLVLPRHRPSGYAIGLLGH